MRKVAEQLSFSTDVIQTIGTLADKLIQKENNQSLDFISSLSVLQRQGKSMTFISQGIYSILENFSLILLQIVITEKFWHLTVLQQDKPMSSRNCFS